MDDLILKNSKIPGQEPQASDLSDGELALNYADGYLYYKNVDGTIKSIRVTDEVVREIIVATKNDNVLYVAKNGLDTNDGESMAAPFASIRKACFEATSGTTIKVLSGDYTEENPIRVPAGVSIVGDNLRSVTVRPANKNKDILYVDNKVYITGITFRDHETPAAAVAFDPSGSIESVTINTQGTNYASNATITFSPPDIPTTAFGIQATATLTITGGAITAVNILQAGSGYVNPPTFTINSATGSGFTATVNLSKPLKDINTSPYVQNCSSITTTGCGMRIDGSLVTGLRSMVVDAYTQFNKGGLGVHIINRGYAQLVSLFTICTSTAILCESGGQCSVTNSNCSFGNFGLKASGVSSKLYDGKFVEFSTGLLDTIVVKGMTQRPSINDVLKFFGGSEYYVVESVQSTGTANQYIITLERNIIDDTPVLDTVCEFYQMSFIASSGHTFEYVGAGTDLITALPSNGGTPIQENEIVEENGGKVFFTSTDHKGDFRIGNDLLVNRADGIIEGRAFEKSLFAILTPYILAIEG